MREPENADWAGPLVAVALCLLTPLVNPYVSMSVGAVAIVVMACVYSRRRRSWIRASVVFAAAMAMSMAIVYWLTRN